MQILQLLKKDHDEVKSQLKQLVGTTGRASKKRDQLFAKIKTALQAHSHAEDRVFYQPLMEHDEAEDAVMKAEVEHKIVEGLLAELEREPKGDARWLAKCTVLMELVEHHVKEEEREMFKLARKAFDKAELERMGDEMMAEKKAEMGGASRGGRAVSRRPQRGQRELRADGRV